MSIVRTNDANNANTNRHVSFIVEIETTPAGGAFEALQGPQNAYPYYGKVQNPSLGQELAQLRLSLLTRVLSRWAILVGVTVASDRAGTGAGSAVVLTYEQDEMGVFYNNAWGSSPGAVPKHSELDITDTVGVGGLVTAPKTKPGLQSLANELGAVSYDGGQSGPFGDLSLDSGSGGTNALGGDVTLPDGRLVPAASIVPLGATAQASGLVVVYLDPTTP